MCKMQTNEFSPNGVVEEREHQRHGNQKMAAEGIVKPNLHSTNTYADSIGEPARVWHRLIRQRHVNEP